VVAEALNEYLRTAAWVSSDTPEAVLAEQVPDDRRRRLLLTELARLVPRDRGQVERVELSGALLGRARVTGGIALGRQGKARINRALDGMPEHRLETHVGDLREIDLDRYSFVLRNLDTREGEVLQVECQFLEELLEDGLASEAGMALRSISNGGL